ncbi:hypothetical protein RND71_043506 [Anisodus tanguticus]|uniref:Uncharacterized protein n=1 Tax=Anisodus tanguticus TaxID=243964 RepID=A0AAE1QPR7_9SOLA|nr:hypothetical protein RND71_043506 [Anisodus tanguticus]
MANLCPEKIDSVESFNEDNLENSSNNKNIIDLDNQVVAAEAANPDVKSIKNEEDSANNTTAEEDTKLQNLLYEAKFFQQEINKSLEFKSKAESIDLVSLDEFFEMAPKEVIENVSRTCRRPEIFKSEEEKKLNNTISLSKNDPKFQENLETLNYIFDLPSHIRAIDLTWNTEFSTPLEIKPLIVSWPSSGKGLVRRVFVSDKKQVENDETATFIKA